MSEVQPFVPPKIEDSDIHWVCQLLCLPPDAFSGRDGTDPRQHVVKSMETLDVAACPGSGKTTLLVAKLAILANKWPERTRGICVLSHTNAARHEIERRLGNTSVGRRLLSYPHFIGTIHAFVNEFLALPGLRSCGFQGTQFSTEVSGERLWRLGRHAGVVQGYLTKNWTRPRDQEDALRSTHYLDGIRDLQLRAGNSTKRLMRSKASQTFRKLDELKRRILDQGYAAYEDTFAYGLEALDGQPWLISVLCDRFPVLFVDEAQDNNEDQSAILHRLFLHQRSSVIRQRLGDENQAIFGFDGDQAARTDPFPSEPRRDLPNSHRFGQGIADLADPLGLKPYLLKGHGPRRALASGLSEGPHTVFLFEGTSIGQVLPTFGQLLIETFSEQELRDGEFTAVGHRHRPPDENTSHKLPHCVGDYWAEYDSDLTTADPKPRTFLQYVFAGRAKAEATGEVFPAIEKIAEGIVRLVSTVIPRATTPRGTRWYRYIVESLDGCEGARQQLDDLMNRLVVERALPTKATWTHRWRGVVRAIAETIASASVSGSDAEEFLSWTDGAHDPQPADAEPRSQDNVFRHPKDNPKVCIRVGSVHSVKGKTTTATLVLETYWKGRGGLHNLELLLPWLCGDKSGFADTGVEQRSRLKVHYVAMTRPTHLLCLAMKTTTLAGSDGKEWLQKMKRRGWQIRHV